MDDRSESPDSGLGLWLPFPDGETAAQLGGIQPLSTNLLHRARALVGDMAVDFDEDIGDVDVFSATDA